MRDLWLQVVFPIQVSIVYIQVYIQASIKVINHLIVFTSKENLHYVCLRRYFKPTEYSLGGLTTYLKLERLVTPIYAENKSLHVQAKLSGQIKYCCMGSYVTLR